jgi:hypothetical protein
MDNSNLESILGGQAAAPAPEVTETPAPETVETQPEQQERAQATTGEQAAPPAEPQKDDPLEKAQKGLAAATKAERERRQAAEARAQQLERELHALRTPPAPPPARQTDDADKPLREQFASEDEWLDARDEWRDRKNQRHAAEVKAQEQARTLYQKTESIYAQAQALEGFDRLAFDRLPLTRPIVEALVESDHAPALMHYMASNPEDVARIAGLSDTRQIAELARIEDKLNAAPPPPPPEEKAKPQLPQTLTTSRNAKGQFEPAYSGPTPLNAILASN